jgi:hypothetical protein
MTLLKDAGLVTSFTETRDGEVLIVDHRGTLWRLAPAEPAGPEPAGRSKAAGPGESPPAHGG